MSHYADLSEINQQLTDEQDLLVAENRLKEEQEQIEYQNHLYDEITAHVSGQLEEISKLVSEAKKDRTKFKKNMQKANFLTAYIKRRANFTFLASRQDMLSVNELMIGIDESLEYLGRCGVVCMHYGQEQEELPAEIVMEFYDAFQKAAEAGLPAMTGMIVKVSSDAEGIKMRLLAENPSSLMQNSSEHLMMSLEQEDETVYYTIHYQKGKQIIRSRKDKINSGISSDGRHKEEYRLKERLRHYGESITELTREREILNAKAQIHARTNRLLLTTRHCIEDPCPEEEILRMFDLWCENVLLLDSGTEPDHRQSLLEELKNAASSVGIQLELCGQLPENKDYIHIFMLAATESMTNAMRHANATVLRITSDETGASFMNDGIHPQGEIHEGGGLTAIRHRAATIGAAVMVTTEPEYCLRLRYPKNGGILR